MKIKGVTLVELMMVILLIGLMTLIALPLISNFGVTKQASAASKTIEKYLRLSRSHAITFSRKQPVYIYSSNSTDKRANTIRIPDPTNLTQDLEKSYLAPSLILIPDVDDQDGSKNDDYDVTITFLPSGKAETTGTDGVFIHVINKAVKIDGNTYSPTANYSLKDETDYKKCHTIAVFNSGAIRRYEHGIEDPWADYDPDDDETPWN